MRSLDEIRQTVETGLGKQFCDLKLQNVRLVNVFSGRIYKTNIHIKGGRIVSIDPDVLLECSQVIECGGQYALPGFIDSHMHFESTMLSPEALADIVVPKGTTTLCCDLMEIANVAGEKGIREMLGSIKSLPYRMLIEVSSRVPTAPNLETTGAALGVEQVEAILDWEESISLGEMDPSKVLFVMDEFLSKIQRTLSRRKIVNGHAIGLNGQELNVYASSGISDDHECVHFEELVARLEVGMKVLVREGSTERNLDTLMRGAVESGTGYENLCFCTDDKHVDDILREGHINYNVNRSIELGVPPMAAIRMASVNAAKHLRIEDELGSITPGRLADIILCDSITDIQPRTVIFEGRVVSRDGRMLEKRHVRQYPAWIKDTVHLKDPITETSFRLPAPNRSRVNINLIELIDLQIINEWKIAQLPVIEGLVQNDLKRDILKIAVVERYGKTGGVGIGFVRGFTLLRGALACSVSHDHHNIVVVGTNDKDMAAAVNCVAEMHGGLSCVVDGVVTGAMRLPIGGLMSEKGSGEVMLELTGMNRAAAEAGCTLPAPYMTLSFISLPTVPRLGLTDIGLIDVEKHRLIPLITDAQL